MRMYSFVGIRENYTARRYMNSEQRAAPCAVWCALSQRIFVCFFGLSLTVLLIVSQIFLWVCCSLFGLILYLIAAIFLRPFLLAADSPELPKMNCRIFNHCKIIIRTTQRSNEVEQLFDVRTLWMLVGCHLMNVHCVFRMLMEESGSKPQTSDNERKFSTNLPLAIFHWLSVCFMIIYYFILLRLSWLRFKCELIMMRDLHCQHVYTYCDA